MKLAAVVVVAGCEGEEVLEVKVESKIRIDKSKIENHFKNYLTGFWTLVAEELHLDVAQVSVQCN